MAKYKKKHRKLALEYAALEHKYLNALHQLVYESVKIVEYDPPPDDPLAQTSKAIKRIQYRGQVFERVKSEEEMHG